MNAGDRARLGGRRGSHAILLAGIAGVAALYVALGTTHQWDFETYYYAAEAYRAGLDPYSLESLSAIAGKPIELPYLYPPVTLLAFIPFTYLSIQVAGALWVVLKCLLALSLMWIWRKDFLPNSSPTLLVAVTLLGFNLALLWDLRTGNVALIEEVLLWIAFLAFVRGRRLVSVCLVALASTFKIYPVLFLGLTLVPVGARRGSPLLLGFGVLLSLTLITLPVPGAERWAGALLHSLGGPRPTLAVDSSALSVFDSLLALGGAPVQLTAWLAPVLYAGYCILLLFLSGPGIFATLGSGSPPRVVVAAVFLWLLLAPRVMAYSYVMAVVPSLVTVRDRFQSTTGRTLVIGLILAPGIVRLLPGQPPAAVGALPFLIVLWLWIGLGALERKSPTTMLPMRHPE